VLVGKPTGGADGVIMSLRVHVGLLALDAVRVNASGVVVLSVQTSGYLIPLDALPAWEVRCGI
jgi:hypothetical protein